LCFSPVKNSVKDGLALQQKGIQAGTAATGESDIYAANRNIMRSIGCTVEEADPVKFNGINFTPGASIVMKPDFACCPGEYNIKFPFPKLVKISARSTLVVRGPGVTIESLDLDGALVVDVERGEEAIIRDLVIKNKGWEFVRDEDSKDEKTRMRGYRIVRHETRSVEVKSSGDDDESQPAPEDDEGEEWVAEEAWCQILPVTSSMPGTISKDESSAGSGSAAPSGNCVIS
jgi:UDP-sugar pyrophosphorylase